MAYCGPLGIPHSIFKGWDLLDQAKALAWRRRESEKCSGCGVHPEVTDPALGGHPDALALSSVICRTCEISETGSKAYQDARMPGEHQVWRGTELFPQTCRPRGGARGPQHHRPAEG